ncbi:hypothetical protein AXG93_2862s1000 [Marchantia polymorpha subsp. ruderalis]|uniref:Uncharacterized protein n=1 Tax=Marchantia polymorpha subsp. ruderalis TaxID=1480154 RepID=A0A176WEF5_MARPO|nr:hypothetical protein AXG93_2862s1000 [Marchantia polymorpha subsp. ruderalis]
MRKEMTFWAKEGGPSGIQAEVSMEVTVELSEERMTTVSPSLPPSERMQSMESEEVPQPKTSEELAKELTLSEEILEHVVAQVGGTIVDAPEISSPPSPEEEVRLKVKKKASKEKPKELVVSYPDFLQDSVVPLLMYLDRKRENYDVTKELGFYVELERKDHLRTKEMECEVLWLNLVKEKDLCESIEQNCVSFQSDIENAQKATVDLRDRLEASKVAYTAESRRVDELTAYLAKRNQLHAAELAKEKELRAEEEQKAEDLRR